MANGMASLYVGVTGLRTAQSALNTTAHNLSNINTEGYTRQQISFEDTKYFEVGSQNKTAPSNYGLGVGVTEIRRIRDQFIDSAYRVENSRLGFYTSQYKAVEEIEDLFGEMQGVTYESYLINLYDSINELSKNPTSTVARSSLIQNATAFLDKSEAVYKGLRDYQTTLNTEVKNMVDKINDLGQSIYTLNKRIAKIESAGIEKANDLRDQRDSLLDELSGYINITYYEAESREVIITAENVPFVSQGEVAPMSTRVIEGTNLVIPIWPGYERDVFEEDRLPSNAKNTDKGELKGLIYARGSRNVDYTDVPVMPDSTKYDLNTPEGLEAYNKAYDEYREKQDYYNLYIEPSPILSAITGFDNLVNGIVEAVNNVLCPEKQVVTTTAYTSEGVELQADEYTYNSVANAVLYDRYGSEVSGIDNGNGTYSYVSEEKLYTDKDATQAVPVDSYVYSMLDMDKTDYGSDDARSVGTEIFSRRTTDRYIVVKDAAGNEVKDADGNPIYIRNNLNERGYESRYCLGNLIMNSKAVQNVATIPLATLQGKEDFSRAEELVDIWDNKFGSINPEDFAKNDFMTYYNNYVGEYATMGRVLYNFVGNQKTMVDGYDNQRLQIEGVSSDEELEKMIKYQQAYNASSRYINVISEMLEHLVTSLGNA